MTSTIQIPNITINGNDYWTNHTSQYNAMIGESITPLTIDLKGYPTSNTISIIDPNNEYEYKDNNDINIINYSLNKGSNLTIKIEKLAEFWEVPREISAQGVYQYPSSNFTVTLPNSVTSIGDYGLYYCFYSCPKLTSFNDNNITSIGNYGLAYCFTGCNVLTTPPTFTNLTTIGTAGLQSCFQNCPSLTTAPAFANVTSIGTDSLNQCFYNCTSLTTAPTFANVTSIGKQGLYYCFQNCTSLTTAPTFASLTTISGSYGLRYCFQNCTSLTTAPTFASLTTISGSYGLAYCFYGCTKLTTAPTFASLTTISGSYGLRYCFQDTKITSLSFPALNSSSFGGRTNVFNNMLKRVTGCTVHFPSNLQSVIGSWSDVTAGFGGTNTTVLFDLPATV